MAKDNTATAQKQVAENPLVSIKYQPEDALATLATDSSKTLALLGKVKIGNPNDLESASSVLQIAELRADQIETFKATLREKVQQAASRFRELPGCEEFFGDFQVTLTVRTWTANSLLVDAIRRVKNLRANYLAEEDRKVRQRQAEAEAEQRRKNQIAADNAAKAAKAQGADKETIAQIKNDVMATPAPIVESKAQMVAENVGASLRYNYTAKITNLKSFLGFCLQNGVMYATLGAAIPEIEKAFRKMAADQKEAFKYPGIEFVKTPVDVSRR